MYTGQCCFQFWSLKLLFVVGGSYQCCVKVLSTNNDGMLGPIWTICTAHPKAQGTLQEGQNEWKSHRIKGQYIYQFISLCSGLPLDFRKVTIDIIES